MASNAERTKAAEELFEAAVEVSREALATTLRVASERDLNPLALLHVVGQMLPSVSWGTFDAEDDTRE
jgi:hypothetical protein